MDFKFVANRGFLRGLIPETSALRPFLERTAQENSVRTETSIPTAKGSKKSKKAKEEKKEEKAPKKRKKQVSEQKEASPKKARRSKYGDIFDDSD